MNEEERRSFLSNNIPLAQINNLKLFLQHDHFRFTCPSQYINENNNDDIKVTLMEAEWILNSLNRIRKLQNVSKS